MLEEYLLLISGGRK